MSAREILRDGVVDLLDKSGIRGERAATGRGGAFNEEHHVFGWVRVPRRLHALLAYDNGVEDGGRELWHGRDVVNFRTAETDSRWVEDTIAGRGSM